MADGIKYDGVDKKIILTVNGNEAAYVSGSNLYVSGALFVNNQNITSSGGESNTYNTNLTLAPVGVYDPNVSLIMHFSGADNSTNIIDSSYNEKAIIVNGNAKISTTQSKYGGSSLYLDGTGDYLTTPDNADFDLGTGDFTIEFWAYCTDQTNNFPTYLATDGVWADGAFAYRFDNTGQGSKFSIHWNPDDPLLSSANTFPNDTWTHTALVRNGNLLTLYVNGNNEASATLSPTRTLDLSRGGNMFIGSSPWDGGAGYVNDYIDDLRILKGIALYTANFTPPTQELTGGLTYLSSSYSGTFNLTGNLLVTGAINTTQTNTWNKPQIGAITTYNNASGSTTIDLAASNNFKLVLSGNVTLQNPSNITEGQSGLITIVQPAGTYYTMSYGSFWKFPSGSVKTLTTTSGAIDALAYYVASSSFAICNLLGNII